MHSDDIIGEFKITSRADVDDIIIVITEKEKEIDENLKTVLSKQCLIESKMSSIGRALSGLSLIGTDSEKIHQQINQTSKLAESVSAKVRRLDEARCRASECQQRVHDLIDLQLCSQGVLMAIREEDFEKGAGHISRFLSMDQNLLQRTADDVQGSVTSVSDAVKTLEHATENMRGLITRKFEEAVTKDDLASIERFFKIFPLVGMHDEGITKFSNYICQKLAVKSQKELRSSLDLAKAEKRLPVAFADTFSTLLENFAKVVEVNQPIIDNCYKAGYILPMVKILQNECDREVKDLILELYKSRQLPRKIEQIKGNQRTAASGNNTNQVLGHYRKGSGGSIDKLNPKDIDAIIAEITIIHSRAELYFRFMKRRILADIEASTTQKQSLVERIDNLDKFLSNCDLSRKMQELLGAYLLLEKYFMEESVLKAIAMDSYETGQQCSSVVDDVFFIIRKSIRRSMTTQSINGTCAVINNAASCLDGDFVNALKSPLKCGYPSGYIDLTQAYNAIQNSLQQGKLQSNDNDKARMQFIVQLNNADVSTEYIETLWKAMEQEINGTFPALSSVEHQIVDSCISELKAVRDSLKACVDFGMQQLRSSAIKPRLNPWIDQFLNYSHHLTEEELATYEAGETFIQFLIIQIDGLLGSFKNMLSSRNYDALISILASEITARLERVIMKSTYNRLGGLVLDQEVRALGSYLTGATSWSVRDKMTRLSQIATLLNLEKVSELSDYWNSENNSDIPSWRLTPNEVRTILTLRTDFRMEDIKRVQI